MDVTAAQIVTVVHLLLSRVGFFYLFNANMAYNFKMNYPIGLIVYIYLLRTKTLIKKEGKQTKYNFPKPL